MGAIFISYRREDSEGHAGRLFEDLREVFGAESVFMDVVGIEPGVDFRKTIDAKVTSCSVLLALMGRQWIDLKTADGRRRLDDPGDFVRLETAAALRRDIPVIPVLVQGAQMPGEAQLPEDLKDLAFRNGVELTHARWESDLQLLLRALGKHVQPLPKAMPAPQGLAQLPPAPPAAAPTPAAAPGGGHTWKIAGGLAAALLVAAVIAAQSGGESGAPAPMPAQETAQPTAGSPAGGPPAAEVAGPVRQVLYGDAQGQVLGTFKPSPGAAGGWVETGADGQKVIFEFNESGRSASEVRLYDASRDVHIRLDLSGQRVMYAQGRDAEVLLYRIVDLR